jgi:hypothetical protein
MRSHEPLSNLCTGPSTPTRRGPRQRHGFTSSSAAAKYRARMQVRAERGELRITRETFAEAPRLFLRGLGQPERRSRSEDRLLPRGATRLRLRPTVYSDRGGLGAAPLIGHHAGHRSAGRPSSGRAAGSRARGHQGHLRRGRCRPGPRRRRRPRHRRAASRIEHRHQAAS